MTSSVAIPLPREIADRWRATKKLASGRRSEVHRVEDRQHGRLAALKIRQIAGDERMFRASLSQAVAFSHAAVAPIYDCVFGGSLCFVVSELFDEDLTARLQRSRWLSLDAAHAMVVRSAQALALAHREGLRHGGIRPSSLLFRAEKSGDATFKLADFAPTGLVASTPAEDVVALGKCLELAIAGAGVRPAQLGNASIAHLLGEMLSGRLSSAERVLDAVDNCVWFGDQRGL